MMHRLVAAFVEFCEQHVLGKGFRIRTALAEQASGPQPEHLVAARDGLEAQFLIVRELVFEAFLALIESRRHALLICRLHGILARAAGGALIIRKTFRRLRSRVRMHT